MEGTIHARTVGESILGAIHVTVTLKPLGRDDSYAADFLVNTGWCLALVDREAVPARR